MRAPPTSSDRARRRIALAACGAALAGAPAAAAGPLACTGPAAPGRIVLAELFSTEGCESCPPAEHVFNGLRPSAQAVPIVWHVDYFDGPGWKDRFALADAAARQQALARAQGLRVVATPQVFLDGLEFGAWRDARALRSRIVRGAAAPAPAAVSVTRVERSGDTLLLDVQGGADPRAGAGLQLQAVVVQDGLASLPTGGENQGRRLVHEHVVRATSGPRPLPAAGDWSARVVLPAPPAGEGGPAFGVVAWTQDAAARVLNASWLQCRAD
jgi:hypothetical protein